MKAKEAALANIHRAVMNRMGERLKARMPKQPAPADLPMADNNPPQSPAAAHVEKLRALASRGK